MTVDGAPLGEITILVVRAGASTGEDGYGNLTAATPTRTPIAGCSLQPFLARNTAETITPSRDTIISRWRLFAPYGSDIKGSDQIEYNALSLQVDGDLMTWEPDEYGDGYCEAYLKRWGG